MKMATKVLMWLGLAALAVGCGGGSSDRTRNAMDPESMAFEIRLLGEKKPADLSAALLGISSVTASSADTSLEVETVASAVDLSVPQAWLLARVHLRLPQCAEAIEFAVRFDETGRYESGEENGTLEARGTEVRWSALVSEVMAARRAVISLDLSHSIIQQGGGTAQLVPNATIVY